MHFGDDGRLLREAVAVDGAQLVSWRVEHVHEQPGGAVTIGYRAVSRRGRSETEDFLFASTAGLSARAAARTDHVVLYDGDQQVTVWRRPCDPELPALPKAMHAEAGGSIELHSYRPLRRAVIVTRRNGGVGTYRKVVRPAGVRELKARHDLCVAAGLPVPRVLQFDEDGLIELAPVAGLSLLDVLAHGGTFELGAVIELLERLPEGLLQVRPVAAWTARAQVYAPLAAERFPELAEQIRPLASRADRWVRTCPAGQVVPTHGDLYEAQLYQLGGQISGLIDLDTAGPGRRADDLACLLGHLAALPYFDPRFRHVAARIGPWFEQAESYLGQVGLGPRVAAVLVTLLGTADAGRADRETQLGRASGMIHEARRFLAA